MLEDILTEHANSDTGRSTELILRSGDRLRGIITRYDADSKLVHLAEPIATTDNTDSPALAAYHMDWHIELAAVIACRWR